MRVPRSGLGNNLTRGVKTLSAYSSGGTLAPNCKISGKMVAAEAPPNSSAETKEGTTRSDVNSLGNDGADSLSVLTGNIEDVAFPFLVGTHRRSAFLSASVPNAKLSNPRQT